MFLTIRSIAGALLTTGLLLPVTTVAHAFADTAAVQLAAARAGTEVQLASSGAAATAFGITTSEDGGKEGFVDLTLTGDSSFSIAADRLRITTSEGKVIAVAEKLTERDPETNLRLREITAPEKIAAGKTVSLRFEFSGAEDLGEASNLSVLTDEALSPVAAWQVR